jgi:hypothetical protein
LRRGLVVDAAMVTGAKDAEVTARVSARAV